MSASSVTLKYLLLGDASSAASAMKKVGGAADETGGRLHGLASKTNVALVAMTGSAVAFGKSSIDTFKQVGAQTLGLQRIIGGTAQDSSRLVFAAQESGVGFESLTKSTGKLEKALVAAGNSSKSNAAMIKTLGFNYRDAQGHILPMSQLLPQIADKFASMPGGAEKTALALQLFGKAGADMLPFLNKGSAGIKNLEKESDKFGTTLTGKNLDALKKAKAGQREWNASLEGLRIQVGAQLLPVMNSLVGFIRDHVIPVITTVTRFVQDHKTAVMIAVGAISAFVVVLKAWSIVQAIINVLLETNPIVLIVTALIALGVAIYEAYKHSQTFRDIVQQAFQVVRQVATDVWNVLKVIFQLWVDQIRAVGAASVWLWQNIIQPIWTVIRAWITAQWILIKAVFDAFVSVGKHIGDGLQWAYDNIVKPIVGSIRAAVQWVHDRVVPIISALSGAFGHIGDGLKWAWDNVIYPIFHFIKGIIQDILNGINDIINKAKHAVDPFSPEVVSGHGSIGPGGIPPPSEPYRFPGAAKGGRVTGGVPYIVGENRPEVFVPDSSGRIIANPRYGSGGRGGDLYFTMTVQAIDAGSFARDPNVHRMLVGALENAANAGLRVNGPLVSR